MAKPTAVKSATKKLKKLPAVKISNKSSNGNGTNAAKKLDHSDIALIRRYEQVPTEIYSNSAIASKAVAAEIAQFIRSKQMVNKNCVLGLATGSSPKGVYKELVRLHKKEGLSFKNVITFNLDEYYPMDPESLHSYVRFMKEHLFNHVNIPESNWNIPLGNLPTDKIADFCQEYERKIELAGGIDLQILGIGHTGHIGFNEPGSRMDSKTRLIALDHSTRAAAAGEFLGLQNTPRKAITLGVSAIMNAQRVILMAWGEGKAPVVKTSVEGAVTEKVPASFLQLHSNATFVLDEAAASQLTRVKNPWLVGNIEWDKKMIRKAVTQLAFSLNKPVLKLTDKDYNDNGMNDLLAAAANGHAYDINIEVFNQLQNTITGWPGGKPNADDSKRPERATPAKKRCLIFSPHPDDDIISMGGTFIRLHEQGHEVHVAYQTSGNIAVSDEEAIRFADFIRDYNKKLDINNKQASEIYKKVNAFIKNKKSSEKDIDELRQIKGMIRKGEAKATCRYVGLPEEDVHFMNLPFYETGLIEKKPLGETDIQLTVELIERIRPHQIFAAGDLADPHGTHKVCLDAIFAALERLKNKSWMKDCWVWLYRGAWQEWDIDQIEMAVPMSPDQVLQKRYAIFKHQSQKDGVVFQGNDSREFWQRAEERNRTTADLYNKLGLAEYAAIEAFVRHKF